MSYVHEKIFSVFITAGIFKNSLKEFRIGKDSIDLLEGHKNLAVFSLMELKFPVSVNCFGFKFFNSFYLLKDMFGLH